ncbi:dnaJ homolog subfamily C member 9-like [Clavelina lepadiformis]|uniref:dnaJ homolog subfamily C member 9-like n=1 Tax=Clavelina lepadiformis TaxID=159417 RepID=UPI00404339DF
MGLLDECEKYFGIRDLYQILDVVKTASAKKIKYAYRKMSLKVHPDRAAESNKDLATKKFQILSKVSSILLDQDLRSIYDTDGEVGDTNSICRENIDDWTQYWKAMFNITVEDMKKFEESYKGSTKEAEDLKAIYLKCEGDMDKIFENQMCSTIEDEPRFRKILQEAIDEKELPDYDVFSKEPTAKRKKRERFYKTEAKEAEQARKKLGLGKATGEEALKQLIQKRQDNRQKEMTSFLDNLEAKYAKPSKRKQTSSGSKKRKKT